MTGKSGSANPVFEIAEVIGTRLASREDTARSAVESAARTLSDLRVAVAK